MRAWFIWSNDFFGTSNLLILSNPIAGPEERVMISEVSLFWVLTLVVLGGIYPVREVSCLETQSTFVATISVHNIVSRLPR